MIEWLHLVILWSRSDKELYNNLSKFNFLPLSIMYYHSLSPYEYFISDHALILYHPTLILTPYLSLSIMDSHPIIPLSFSIIPLSFSITLLSFHVLSCTLTLLFHHHHILSLSIMHSHPIILLSFSITILSFRFFLSFYF